jgi:NCS2 family nucleobase:cation symporter-2
MGMNVAPTLVGISASTGVTSRAVAYVAAAILLMIGCSPKLVGVFMLVPPEVAGSVLVFTSCFMIVGGMTIILSRSADLRGNFVIGISTLLALSENAFPEYFRDLSPAVRTITSSPLALGLTAALALTLLFRLGQRQLAKIDWSGSDQSTAATIAFLRSTQKSWNITAQATDRSVADIANVLAYIVSARAHSPDGSVSVIYNGVELRVDIRSRSGASIQLPVNVPGPVAIAGELDNEEAVAYLGLRNFIDGLMADRKELRREGEIVVARLYYAL